MAGQRESSLLQVDTEDFERGLIAAFEQVEAQGLDEVSRLAYKARDAMVRYCPVDSGRLRRSLGVQRGKDDQGVYYEVGSIRDPGPNKTSTAPATGNGTVPYAVWTEFGSSKMAPQPWFRPGLAEAVGFSAGTITGPRSRRSSFRTDLSVSVTQTSTAA